MSFQTGAGVETHAAGAAAACLLELEDESLPQTALVFDMTTEVPLQQVSQYSSTCLGGKISKKKTKLTW